jgi:hypothetical protein
MRLARARRPQGRSAPQRVLCSGRRAPSPALRIGSSNPVRASFAMAKNKLPASPSRHAGGEGRIVRAACSTPRGRPAAVQRRSSVVLAASPQARPFGTAGLACRRLVEPPFYRGFETLPHSDFRRIADSRSESIMSHWRRGRDCSPLRASSLAPAQDRRRSRAGVLRRRCAAARRTLLFISRVRIPASCPTERWRKPVRQS